MESIDNIVRLLHKHLLKLVDTVLYDFHFHLTSRNVVAIRLHECDAEPLGSEALLFNENTSCELVQLSSHGFLLVLSNV
jgi:predicted deacylase